jgi:predicted phosphodiesterase
VAVNQFVTLLTADVVKKFPDAPVRTIARHLVEKYPEHYKDFEYARKKVQRVLHGCPSSGAKAILPREKRNTPEMIEKYKLTSKAQLSEDYIFEYKKPLILSDVHLPFHDDQALETAILYGKDQGIDSVYLNGDILDFYDISRFLKTKVVMSASEEREYFYRFIEMLNNELNVPIYYKLGNHEERWEHYIMRNAPAFGDFDDFNFETVFKLKELGITYIEGRQKTYMGNLIVIHGHEAGESFFSPVNPARGAFLKYKTSTLAGHNHQTSSHFESNLSNVQIACYSTGCLCALNPDYRPFAYTKWNHGFAIVEIQEDGNCNVDNYRIKDGKVYL